MTTLTSDYVIFSQSCIDAHAEMAEKAVSA